MNKIIDNLSIEDAKIIYRNFAGRQSQYNRAGDRNFSVIIDNDEDAQRLINDGWNLSILKARDEDEPDRYKLKVNVKYDDKYRYRNPKVYLHTKKNWKGTILDAETVGTLDFADILSIDLIIRPYVWEINGKSGVSAYLKTMHVMIDEDEFAYKYSEEESPEE